MPKINILPLPLRDKIAAGEVVERPASVVKELMENSIDADSTRIAVETARAGKKLIKVSDNGCGMDREDALLAFERYATSKIRDEKDLFDIKTMGFRGEALSSIASVSKVRMITAPENPPLPKVGKEGLIGACIEISGGKISDITDCPAAGTAIEVKELFFNIPARRKFLKSDTTENYHIIDAVTREALSHHHISFTLRMDGEEVLNLPAASSLRERLLQIYGKDFMEGMTAAGSGNKQMAVEAFLSKTSNFRNNRNNQFIFINKRPVKDQSVSYAVYKAYEGVIPKDKYPVFFIFLELDPAKVDFNVHPAKREVRFEDKSSVFDFVYHAVKSAVNREPEGSGAWNAEAVRTSVPGHAAPVSAEYVFQAGSGIPEQTLSEAAAPFYAGSVPSIYLGDTFVAVPSSGGITIIDYHAAHERVNYEKLLKRTDAYSSPLLFPQQVKMQGGDYKIIVGNLKLLEDFGLDVEDFGHGSVIVRSLPEMLRDSDINALMSDVAASLLGKDSGAALVSDGAFEPVDSVRKAVAARLACHTSIRGREEAPDSVRVAELLKSLSQCENPDFCPHGRPTRITLSLGELRKMFRK